MSEQNPASTHLKDSDRHIHDSLVDALPIAEIEKGDKVSFELGFDKDKLAKLDCTTLVDKKTWDYENKVERTKAVLEVYSRLPESMQFEPGITAIFGDNGQGKTLLADVIVMALRMEQFRKQSNLSKEVDLLDEDSDFYLSIPGKLNGSGQVNYNAERDHAQFIARIADCVNVAGMVLHDPEIEIGTAMRTPAALGNVAMGLSSRQAIDLLGSMQRVSERTSVGIYDEPELGLSPRRHKEDLLPMLSERVADGRVELVPSNSIILYESVKVPRIDLDTPERGIFTPSAN